jgi:hypothetical protein
MKLKTGPVRISKSIIFLNLVCFDNLFLLNSEKTPRWIPISCNDITCDFDFNLWDKIL